MKTALIIATVGTFLIACSTVPEHYRNGRYDFDFYGLEKNRDVLREIEGCLYLVRTEAELKVEGKDPWIDEQKGMAFSLNGTYLITLKHIIEIDTMVNFWGPFGMIVKEEAQKRNEKQFLKEETYEGEPTEIKMNALSDDTDIAILSDSGRVFSKLPVRIGNSDELEVGQALILSSTTHMYGHLFRVGTVSKLTGISLIQDSELAMADQVFMFTGMVNNGDSGNPVFALRDGELELVGIIQGCYVQSEGTGWALKINYVLEEIEKLLNAM